MNGKKTLRVIGLMCGTSRDGLDLADATFSHEGGRWKYIMHNCSFFPMPDGLGKKLSLAESIGSLDILKLDREVAQFFSVCVRNYLHESQAQPDFVASHGITVFHQPSEGITWQIGNGAAMATQIGLPVVCDFRSADVALGGQGAPLVPKGEMELFKDYSACLNLGGFANITILNEAVPRAFDICPCNIVLNELAQKAGQAYDHNGNMARSGNAIPPLLDELGQLEYYSAPPPKSLGKEWVESNLRPLLLKYAHYNSADLLHTFTVHFAKEIALAAKHMEECLITGGGAYNSFLLDLLRQQAGIKWTIPEKQLIDYKEALLFGFLGVLRWLALPNNVPSATGASKRVSGGAVYLP